ncbi:hypothetical protein ACOSQ4_016909 [Xanthoceras sorbifolium]
MFVLLNNCTEAGISDRHNIKIDHNCTMEGHFGFMLNTIDDDNRFPAGSNNVSGKEFDSVEEVEGYYHKYSYLKGFSVRMDDLRRNKQGLIAIRGWVCSKEGFREKNYDERPNRLREPRGQTREGCRAAMRFVTEHSHNLTNAKHTQFLRSHQIVKEFNMPIMHSLKSVGVKTSQVIDHRDLQNIIDAKRRTLFSDFDVDAIINGMSCNDYQIFGDVLYFDTTYKTNAYRRPLVIFVNVNHHNKPTVFGFELLVDETVETYSWILKTFLSAMHGKCLTLVVTNGNKSMRKAIKAEMSGSVHQLCSWHLQQNAQTNLGDTDFTRAFSHCIVAFMTKSEFETKWHASIDWFRLHGNAWVTKMNSKCKHTQRSESINAYLNRFLSCRLKLYKFMRQIDRTIVRLHHSKMKDDFDTLNEHPILVTHLELLEKRHAVELYTWGIFQLVRDEIKEEAKLSVCNFVNSVELQTYTFRKFDGGNKTWNYSRLGACQQCSCKLFAANIPCRHTFGVMKAQNMHHIPHTLLKNAAESKVSFDGTSHDLIKVARYV